MDRKANSEAIAPAFAGGSEGKICSIICREALRLYEADPALSKYNWRYLNTIVLLGQTLEKMDDYNGGSSDLSESPEQRTPTSGVSAMSCCQLSKRNGNRKTFRPASFLLLLTSST